MTAERTEYRRWARRRAMFAESKKHGATDDTAWARADAVYSVDGKWQKSCARCGDSFESRRADARFCGPVCRQAAHRTNTPAKDNTRDDRVR